MKTGIGLLIIIPVLCAAFFCQARLTEQRYGKFEPLAECPWCEDKRTQEDVAFIPLNASFLRLWAPADPDFIADMLGLRTAGYFGQHALTDRQSPYLCHLLDLITDLAPLWDFPYFFAAVILPLEAEQVEDGFYFIDKGLVYFPEDWQLWFFKGFYLWRWTGDLAAAADALHRASLKPGAPVYLAALSATFATQAGNRELGLRFLKEALNQFEDPLHRRLLSEKIEEILSND